MRMRASPAYGRPALLVEHVEMSDEIFQPMPVTGSGDHHVSGPWQAVGVQHMTAVEPDDTGYDGDLAGLERGEEAHVDQRDRVVA